MVAWRTSLILPQNTQQVLPLLMPSSTVNKCTGLRVALEYLSLNDFEIVVDNTCYQKTPFETLCLAY